MSLKIKVCGITSNVVADSLSAMGVDYIGFINIPRSKRYVNIEDINKITRNINKKDYSTLILDTENPQIVIKKIKETEFNRVQFHSNITCHDIDLIKEWDNNINITMTVGIKNKLTSDIEEKLESYSHHADNILFDYVKDGLTGGTNTHIPIKTAVVASNIVKNANKRCNTILAGGLNYDYLKDIYNELDNFDMIDLNSGVEDSPGIKNLVKIEKIIDLIKN